LLVRFHRVSTGNKKGLNMGMTLNTKTVAALQPHDDGSERIIFDNEIRQFGVRVRRDSEGMTRRAWIVRYKIGTAQFRPKIGDYPIVSAEQARKAAKDLLAKVQLGGDPLAEKKKAAAGFSRSSTSIWRRRSVTLRRMPFAPHRSRRPRFI
jgi:hypothetical protein